MKNLLSYCGLLDARITASDKDLPVHNMLKVGNWKVAPKQVQFSGKYYSTKFKLTQFIFLCWIILSKLSWYVQKLP